MKNVIVLSLFIFPLIVHAQFDGVVGREGCKAVSCKDKRIVAWAKSCTLIRGFQDIAKPENGQVSYGEAADAVGVVHDSDATDVVSLGDGGVAVLSFANPIVNKEGYDFAVFENSPNDAFLELAFVEVSSDSIHFYRFPATSYTAADAQIGTFGSIDATRINNLAGKYRLGWGTPFDLSDLADAENLDRNQVKYVRIIDVVGSIDSNYASYDSAGRIINDPYPTNFASGGFDLAGVGVIHNAFSAVEQTVVASFSVFPNPCKEMLTVDGDVGKFVLYTSLGQKVIEIDKQTQSVEINMQSYPAGMYFIGFQSATSSHKYVKIIKQP